MLGYFKGPEQNTKQSTSKDKEASTTGCEDSDLDSLRSHEKSAGHVMRVDAKVLKNKGTRKGTINAALLRLEKDTVAKMQKMFNTAYYVCYLKMPFSSFPHLCSLQTINWTYVRPNI